MKRRIIGGAAIFFMILVFGCTDQTAPVTSDQQVVPAQEKKEDSMPEKHDTLLVNKTVAEKPVEEKQKLGTVAKDKKEVANTTVQPEAETIPDTQNGKELIAGADCMTCHKVNQKVIGPSFQEVAQKYASNSGAIELLAGKIIAGGSGTWGQIPMAPHPGIPVADARKMVAYILSLK
ncbi:MAG: c-type cytochrome [Chitinophagaceae bacterium]